ncbi:MAG: cyclic nucleotide-binding domain-containing protein [Acidobacteria bacterium]|nr:cyclic nucleotide-binding domain-containing protein [Acidobacteriota bacterium]
MTRGQPELFRGLAQEEIDQALATGKRITVAKGAQLFALGSDADHLYIIERGVVRLTLPMQIRGRDEDVMVEERTPGQTVGWSALIPPYRFTLKATASMEAELIVLPREALRSFLEARPAAGHTVMLNLAAVIGQRLQLFQAMWLREMQRMVEQRCA